MHLLSVFSSPWWFSKACHLALALVLVESTTVDDLFGVPKQVKSEVLESLETKEKQVGELQTSVKSLRSKLEIVGM